MDPENTTQPKIYLTPAEWGRIYAKAWQNEDFKKAYELDPIRAIRQAFPEMEFERVYKVPPPPPHLTDEQGNLLANEKENIYLEGSTGPLIYYHGG